MPSLWHQMLSLGHLRLRDGSDTAQRHPWAHVSPCVVWGLRPWGPGPPEMGFQAVSQDLSPSGAANAQKQQPTVPEAIRGAGGHGSSVTLARDQGPTGPRGHQSLGFLGGHLETVALARRAGLAGALSSAPRPADPTGGSGWHRGRINSPRSSHAANSPLIRFMCLFFFAIGCGNANSVASYSVSRRLQLAALGGLSPAAPTPPALRTVTHPSGAIRAGLAAGDGRGRAISWNTYHVTLVAGEVELGK